MTCRHSTKPPYPQPRPHSPDGRGSRLTPDGRTARRLTDATPPTEDITGCYKHYPFIRHRPRLEQQEKPHLREDAPPRTRHPATGARCPRAARPPRLVQSAAARLVRSCALRRPPRSSARLVAARPSALGWLARRGNGARMVREKGRGKGEGAGTGGKRAEMAEVRGKSDGYQTHSPPITPDLPTPRSLSPCAAPFTGCAAEAERVRSGDLAGGWRGVGGGVGVERGRAANPREGGPVCM